jgi:hypothetical protein
MLSSTKQTGKKEKEMYGIEWKITSTWQYHLGYQAFPSEYSPYTVVIAKGEYLKLTFQELRPIGQNSKTRPFIFHVFNPMFVENPDPSLMSPLFVHSKLSELYSEGTHFKIQSGNQPY